MSFAASLDEGRLEYGSTGLSAMLGQRENVVNWRFLTMLRDVVRFYSAAPKVLRDQRLSELSLGEYLDRGRYSSAFVEDHLLPMGAAIWSTTAQQMRDYPLFAFVRFFMSHGLLELAHRPLWRTVRGGSIEYVNRMLASIGDVRLGAGAAQIRREAGRVTVIDAHGQRDSFDDVVIATHADQALRLLADPDETEAALLGAFGSASLGFLNAPKERDAALVTFVATASGLSFFGIGAAFWGLVAGGAMLALGRLGKKP